MRIYKNNGPTCKVHLYFFIELTPDVYSSSFPEPFPYPAPPGKRPWEWGWCLFLQHTIHSSVESTATHPIHEPNFGLFRSYPIQQKQPIKQLITTPTLTMNSSLRKQPPHIGRLLRQLFSQAEWTPKSKRCVPISRWMSTDSCIKFFVSLHVLHSANEL